MGIIARQSIKASLLGLIGVAIGAVSRLFLYTKFLSTSEIGTLETIVKLGLLLTPFFIIGAPQVITRYFHRFKNDKDDSGLIFTYSSLLLFVLIPISSLLYLLNKDFIYSLYTEAPELEKYFWLPLVVAISYGGFNFLKSISIVHLRITIPAFFSGVLDRMLVMFLLFAFGYFHWIDVQQFYYLNILLFFCLPFALMVIYVFAYLKPKLKLPSFKQSLNILNVSRSYNSYLLFGSISSVVIASIDVNMIAGGLGLELAGVYTIAYFMGMVIEIPKRSLTNIIYPILNKAVIKKDALEIKSLYQKSSINQFLVGSFIFLIIWLNIDQIFMIIPNGDDFVAGKLVVLFIGLSKLFDMLMGVNKEIIELSKYYRFNLVLAVLLSVLVIVLNLIFIPLKSAVFGGINGVAFASLLALFISNLLAFVIVWRKEKIHPFTLNHGKIFVVISLSSMLCYFIQVEHPILSVCLTTACITLCYIFLTLALNISEDFMNLFEAAKDKLIKK